jgi:hypothetical protein
MKAPIIVESRRKKRAAVEKTCPGALILDVTSRGEEPWLRFSPFYPHGGIPVPNAPGTFAQSVEGLWQGLKVFEHEDIDPSRWQITDLRGIKRAGRTRGRVLGHRFGVGGGVLLGYRDARCRVYLPAYRWVLENRLVAEVGAAAVGGGGGAGRAARLRDQRGHRGPVPSPVPRRPGEALPGGDVARDGPLRRAAGLGSVARSPPLRGRFETHGKRSATCWRAGKPGRQKYPLADRISTHSRYNFMQVFAGWANATGLGTV